MRDCNGDGLVDCDDFAAIHKLGPHQCRSEAVISTDYWKNYEQCSSSTSSSGVGIIEARTSGARGTDGGAESVLSRSESFAPRFSNIPSRSFSNDHRDQPSSSVHPFHGRNDGNNGFNAISLPFPNKPPVENFPRSQGHFTTTARPDLPLITPRRNILSQQNYRNFRRGRGRYFGPTEKPIIEVTKECLACICEVSIGGHLYSCIFHLVRLQGLLGT